MEVLQIRTSNDRNGNSRVLWVAIENGAVRDAEVDCYNKPARFRHMMDVVITVTPTEFKRWRFIVDSVRDRLFRENGPLPLPA